MTDEAFLLWRELREAEEGGVEMVMLGDVAPFVLTPFASNSGFCKQTINTCTLKDLKVKINNPRKFEHVIWFIKQNPLLLLLLLLGASTGEYVWLFVYFIETLTTLATYSLPN